MTRRHHITAKLLAGLLCSFLITVQTGLAEPLSDGTKTAPVRSGEQVFQQACFSCHGTGFYGAPVIGDTYEWKDRLLKGETAMVESTLEGLNSMPARGGCVDCTDAEITAAVRYLISN